MTDQVLVLKVAAYIFLFVGIMHLLRIIFQVKVTFGKFVVPLWFSLVGTLVALGLSFWMFSVIK